MLESFEAYFDVKSSVSIKHMGWPTLSQSRSVNRDMEISHGIMQCLPENKMLTSRFSYTEIIFLDYNPYGIYMIVRNIICLSWIIVKDQGTGEVVIASYWESTSVVSRPNQKLMSLSSISCQSTNPWINQHWLCMLKSEIRINSHTINDQPKSHSTSSRSKAR